MSNTINSVIANTPGWVYILFIFLVYRGVKAFKPRIVRLIKIFILPFLFLLMSLHMSSNVPVGNFLQFVVGILALLVGAGIGWVDILRFPIKVDRQHQLLEIPGTWSILIIVLVVFFANYYFQYMLHAQPIVAQQNSFVISMMAVFGAAKGYFIGRALALWHCFKRPKIVTDLSIYRDFK